MKMLTLPFGPQSPSLLSLTCIVFVLQETSKRVITLSNDNDFISFRHHTFEKPRGTKSVALTECGPRFELKLYQIRCKVFWGCSDQALNATFLVDMAVWAALRAQALPDQVHLIVVLFRYSRGRYLDSQCESVGCALSSSSTRSGTSYCGAIQIQP